jgi:hypothetical protein
VKYQGFDKYEKPNSNSQDAFLGYVCGHCSTTVSGMVISRVRDQKLPGSSPLSYWLVCPSCGDGSYMREAGEIYPGAPQGESVRGLPEGIEAAYREARNFMSFHAYTSCELICRKILMHVAVEKHAAEGESFAF